MKLKQIKEFTAENISEELAGELCLWKEYEKGKGFTITNKWCGTWKTGGSTMFSSDWDDPNFTMENYIRTHTGVEIKINRSTHHELRIWGDGKATMYSFYKEEELKSYFTGDTSRGLPPKGERFEKYTSYHEYPCSPQKLMQLYIDNGFYTVEL